MKKIIFYIYLFIFSSIEICIYSQTSPDAYARLDGDEGALIERLTGPRNNLKIITGKDAIPECYRQKRFCVTFQALWERINKKYRRPSLSHFQSVKEYTINNDDGTFRKYIFFTGGNIIQWQANLMIAKQDQEGNFFVLKTVVINTKRDDNPLVDEFELGHPGGIDICGNHLVVPLEPFSNPREDRIRAVFFDISDPENPQRVYDFDLKNNAGEKIPSCPGLAFTRLIDGRYIIACQSGYFVSQGNTVDSGFIFSGKINFVNPHNFPAKDFGTPQNLSFVTLSGQIYLVATGGTCNLAPVVMGENLANLYKFNLNAIPGHDVTAELVAQIPYGKENLLSPDFDFNAAATVTSQCSMLSIYHWVWCETCRGSCCCCEAQTGKYIPCCCFGPI